MISVEQALDIAFELARPLDTETIDLASGADRVLARAAHAGHDQPPFDASAMDGYAARAADCVPGARLQVVGEVAAGGGFQGRIGTGQAVRIFTGAPLPKGADRVIIQEDVTTGNDTITLAQAPDPNTYIRHKGSDFAKGTRFDPPCRLGPAQLALLATMNVARITVTRKPDVAIIATGDELVELGSRLQPGQIVSSNSIALAQIVRSEGSNPRILPIARDNEASLRAAFELARGADLIVTTGGASVGDYDLVGPVARELGLQTGFYKVAMRPGKPLMAGRMGDTMLLGLPGNPVSTQVCAHVFLRPVLRKMTGLPAAALPTLRGTLASALGPNGPRAHYMRAVIGTDGRLTPAASQDSAMTAIMAGASALIVRPAHDPARPKASPVAYLPL